MNIPYSLTYADSEDPESLMKPSEGTLHFENLFTALEAVLINPNLRTVLIRGSDEQIRRLIKVKDDEKRRIITIYVHDQPVIGFRRIPLIIREGDIRRSKTIQTWKKRLLEVCRGLFHDEELIRATRSSK